MKKDIIVQKVWDIYRFIDENLYLNRPDLKAGENAFNSALLLGILTALNQGKEMIVGEPGLGKTTSAEYICAMVYRIPLGLLWTGVVSGHPEQTEEKIIGRPHLGRLNQGEEVVVWSYFSQLPTKIVDEINRLPETKQSIILDGVDRGKWEYMNDVIINAEYCLFATANYQDRGTNTMIAPLVDRFDVMVESKHPGSAMALQISKKNRKNHFLRNIEYENRFNEIFLRDENYHDKMKRFELLCNEFGDWVERECHLKLLSAEERRDIRQTSYNIPLDLDSTAFLSTVVAELSFCYKYGAKRTNEHCPQGCHYSGYTCHQIKNCISNRFPISVRTYAQSLAWLLGDEKVTLEHMQTVMPYVLAHRLKWKDEYVSRQESHTRRECLPIYLARNTVKNILKRYNEQSLHVMSAMAVAHQNFTGNRIPPVEGDHPIYAEIKKDIEDGVARPNLFKDFKDCSYQTKEIPLDRLIEPKQKIREQIIQGYARCLQMKTGDLGRGVEERKIIEAYSLAEKSLSALDYDVDDIEAFFIELCNGEGNPISRDINGLTGIYLSALFNNVDDEKLHLDLLPMSQKIDFLGYRLPERKTLTLKGDVGNFAGANLCGGDLLVEGAVGDCAGAGMDTGRLFISKTAGLRTGEWKSGGEIHVQGGIGSLGIHITGGYVYQAGQLKKYG